jgi:hypothetical protein
MSSPIGGVGGSGNVFLGSDVGSLSIEDALLLVQMDRVRLCESQLQDQINSIRAKNDQMAKLNDLKTKITELKADFKSDAKETDSLSKNLASGKKWDPDVKNTATELADGWQKLGLDPSYVDKFTNGTITKGELAAAEQVIKSQTDSLSSSSQMDMVRLQSLNNKRSEAFDTMTNMLKKASDSKSSVVSNFR